mmetsp:Transcript_4663/g.10299  ORF Transcript_4663/g.10299 Transcript_4663/m.10299 type:complete len:295 (+) Transcript_4663:105-989(+)|eukprot:CAMPEP_0204264622 /NCGR_PEP_ID=MMETSP0468-20130131/9135_1 /ASSEMBLY_ACC=CAM_ASM_000383 /TAXON_ID=2969 /ORGANISM="Oxyrrhis marina" /LENGTH=294 /DNA_ID=CAMNT_0051239503 /DNA_START=40 /DNA_END=924 /DNA_ORIENTATION=+
MKAGVGTSEKIVRKEAPAAPSHNKTNAISAVLSLLATWGSFATVMVVMSSHMRYSSPVLAWIIFAVVCMVPVACVVLAVRTYKRGHASYWFEFSTFTITAGVVLGLLVASMVFHFNFLHTWEMSTLQRYTRVDPAVAQGRSMVDAGVVEFVNGTHLDHSRSMGFKNVDMYCVVPIVAPAAHTLTDFWAVGMNCCGDGSDFECGDTKKPGTLGGLRVLEDEHSPFYDLAVEQAEGKYGVEVRDPVFFYWTQGGDQLLQSSWDHGSHLWWRFLLGYLFLSAAGVSVFWASHIKSKD